MSLSPNIVSFNYKKGDPIPAGVQINHDDNAVFENTPSWLEWYDVTTSNSKIRVVAAQADNLSVGNHSVEISAKIVDPDLGDIYIGSLTVNIAITEPIVLSVSPLLLNYNYEIGGAQPSSQNLIINSENSWTVTKTNAWLTLSTGSGSGFGSVEVGVVTTGLSENLYTDTIVVDDGVTTINIPVSFTVGQPNTGSDYLYVNPPNINFSFTVDGKLPPSKNIDINTSGSWTSSVSVPWLELSATSGSSGTQTIQLSLKAGTDLDNLTEGDYSATVTITNGDINRTINVVLSVYDFVTVLPSDEDLLFAEDENLVKLDSSRLDSYMKLDISSVYNQKSLLYTLKLPIFKGGATRDLGEVPKDIISSPTTPLTLTTFNVFEPYKPCEVNLTLTETELFTDSGIATTLVNNLKFIKGYKPTDHWISENAKTIFVSNKGVIVFSVLSYGEVLNELTVSGDYEEIIDLTDVIKSNIEHYTVVIPVSRFGSFTPGDAFTVTLFEDVNIIIKEDEIDFTQVLWENQWGCIDCIELNGDYTEAPSYNRRLFDYSRMAQKINTVITETELPVEYKINTGYIVNDVQLDAINKMLSAKNVWIVRNGVTTKVLPVTRKISLYNSLRTASNFDLTFRSEEK